MHRHNSFARTGEISRMWSPTGRRIPLIEVEQRSRMWSLTENLTVTLRWQITWNLQRLMDWQKNVHFSKIYSSSSLRFRASNNCVLSDISFYCISSSICSSCFNSSHLTLIALIDFFISEGLFLFLCSFLHYNGHAGQIQ